MAELVKCPEDSCRVQAEGMLINPETGEEFSGSRPPERGLDRREARGRKDPPRPGGGRGGPARGHAPAWRWRPERHTGRPHIQRRARSRPARGRSSCRWSASSGSSRYTLPGEGPAPQYRGADVQDRDSRPRNRLM